MQPPRLPLGNPCRGRCSSAIGASAEPGLDDIRKLCNVGYARGRCERFPAAFEGPDAIRFSITRDDSDTISLLCIYEKDYSPSGHSPVIYDTLTRCFTIQPGSSILEAQARLFVDSYLSRKIKP